MAKKYLDVTGLTYFFNKIKALIPTKTSQLTNDSSFLTSIPSEYVTETELATELSGVSNSLAKIGDTSSLKTNVKSDVVSAINEVHDDIPTNQELVNLIYPVGSIYISANTTNPATLFGIGTWERLQSGFIYAASGSFSQSTITGTNTGSYSGTSGSYSGTSGKYSGTTGSTTLTVDQIPSHTHRQVGHTTSTSGTKMGIRMVQMTSVNTSNTTTVDSAEKTGGGQGHTHSIPEHTHSIPEHTHSIPEHTHSIPSHSHAVPYIACIIWKRTA